MRLLDAGGREIRTTDPVRLRARIEAGEVAAVLVASLDRLPAWIGADLLELLGRHRVAIVAGAERIDTSTAAGRLALAEARRALVDAAG